MVLKTDLENIYTLLMLDLPGAFTNVDRQMFDFWKKDTLEVFRIAQANINKQVVEKVTQKFSIDGSEIEVSFIGDENYAASYALDLPNNSPDLIGEWGSIVAIPNKGLVNICKISKERPLDFVKFIQRTKPVRYFNIIFPKNFVRALLKIKTDELYKQKTSQTAEIKDSLTAYIFYSTFDKLKNLLELNFASRTKHKDEKGEPLDGGESNTIYYFKVTKQGQLKFKKIRIAG